MLRVIILLPFLAFDDGIKTVMGIKKKKHAKGTVEKVHFHKFQCHSLFVILSAARQTFLLSLKVVTFLQNAKLKSKQHQSG